MAKRKKSAGKLSKAVAPTKSTSGEGYAVEDKIAALCSAALLLSRSPFANLPGRLTRIDFQVAVDHWEFNDLLLTVEGTTGTYRAATSIRSKREITSGGFSTEIKNALFAQFTKPAPNPFDRTRDRLVLIAAEHAQEVTTAIHALTLTARGNAALLPTRINEPGFTNDTGRALYADLEAHRDAAKITGVSAADVLHSFVLEELDMNAMAAAHPPAGLSLCTELLRAPDLVTALALWEALVGECVKQKQATGYLDLPRLLDAVRSRFGLKSFPFDAADWTKIDTESRGHLDLVKDDIVGHRFPRQAVFEPILAGVGANAVTVLVGSSGTGKSSLAKRLVEATAGSYSTRVWTRVQGWSQPQAGTLGTALGLPALTHDLSALFERVCGPALLVVDGVEHCTDAARVGLLTKLLRLCRPTDSKSPWRVVLLARAEEWSGIREQLAIAARDIQIRAVPLEDFSRAELLEMAVKFPELRPLIRQPHLAGLLRKPKILALVTEHLHAGGTLDANALTGESHLARWFWQDRIRRGDHAVLRARAARLLAEKQAELVQSEIPEAVIDHVLLPACMELVRDGICVLRHERIAFQHDLYADWARLEILIAEGNQWVNFAADRISSPHWHRAVRLYGVWLLEQAANGADQWADQVANLSTGGVAVRLIADLFLEAPIFSAAPFENLSKVWPHLIAEKGEFLRRMLKRIRLSASAPDEAMIAHLNQAAEISREYLVAEVRMPYPQYWIPLLSVLDAHRDEAVKLAAVGVARTAQSWLDFSAPGWPGRMEAAELAVLNAEREVADAAAATHPHYGDREIENTIFQAAMAAMPDLPVRVAALLRKLAGLIPADGRKAFPKQRWITISHGIGSGAGVTYELPPPWPGGPYDRPNRSFQHLLLHTRALFPVMRVDAALARELTLAACISAPEVEESFYRSDHGEPQEVVADESFQSPFYTRGPFLALCQVNPREGMDLILALTNFFTDRWLTWAGRRRSDPRSITIAGKNGPENWLGDHRLYFAHRDAPTCNHFVVSALMALEKWLLDRIEKGESVDTDIDYLLAQSKSLAIAGVLISVAKRSPQLLFNPLWPLVSSPEIHDIEYHCFNTGMGARTGLRSTAIEQKLASEWNKLPQHQVQLFEVCRQCLPYPDAQTKLAALAAEWKVALKKPDELKVNPGFLWHLAELFDPANWKQAPIEGGIEWRYEAPAPLIEADQARRATSQGELSLLTIPIDCRTILDKGEVLSDRQLEDRYLVLDQLPPGPILDDDGASTVASLADAQCGIVAVLVHCGGEWLAKSPEKISRCREIVLHHLNHPPAPRRFMFDDTPFNHTWENFCAEVAPVFLAADPTSVDWRMVVGELAGRPHLQTVRILFRRAAAVRTRLGIIFPQMVDLLVWVAAARQIVNVSEYEEKKPLDWAVWWPPRCDAFVGGTLAPPPSDWESIDVVSPAKAPRHENRSWANLDLDVVVAGLAWLRSFNQATDATERDRWCAWSKSLLKSLTATIPRRSEDRERAPLPNRDEHSALDFLGRLLATMPDPAERRQLWEPLFALGEPASHYIRYFLQAFFNAGFQNPTAVFAGAWQEFVTWAWAAPSWHGQDAHLAHELREVWWTLLLLDNGGMLGLTADQAGLLAAMKPHYEKWAAVHLADGWSAQRFVQLLRHPAAETIFADGLAWLDRSIDRDPKKRWHLRDLVPHLSDFLVWTWSKREAKLRAEPTAFIAYKNLLVLLAAEQDQAALALLTRVAGTGII